MNTLATDKAQTAFAEFVDCDLIFMDAIKTMERKFVQRQAAVSAHLDKFYSCLPAKRQSRKNVTG